METIIALFKFSMLIIMSIGVYSFFSVSEEDREFIREQKRVSKSQIDTEKNK